LNKGRLISFEGLDGAGKTTQIQMLEGWLKTQDTPYLLTREPGGTPLGDNIREVLLYHPELDITALAEAFLFQADRAQHFDKVVIPALQEGKLVITDRSLDASIAYQGYARGIGVKFVEELSLVATQGYVPDLTILLDLNPAQVNSRVVRQLDLPFLSGETVDQNGVREEENRLDAETKSFHQLVRDGFHDLARAHPERIKVVDASRSIHQIHQKIVTLIRPLLYFDRKSKENTSYKEECKGSEESIEAL
jgi:dTMP kinase